MDLRKGSLCRVEVLVGRLKIVRLVGRVNEGADLRSYNRFDKFGNNWRLTGGDISYRLQSLFHLKSGSRWCSDWFPSPALYSPFLCALLQITFQGGLYWHMSSHMEDTSALASSFSKVLLQAVCLAGSNFSVNVRIQNNLNIYQKIWPYMTSIFFFWKTYVQRPPNDLVLPAFTQRTRQLSTFANIHSTGPVASTI